MREVTSADRDALSRALKKARSTFHWLVTFPLSAAAISLCVFIGWASRPVISLNWVAAAALISFLVFLFASAITVVLGWRQRNRKKWLAQMQRDELLLAFGEPMEGTYRVLVGWPSEIVYKGSLFDVGNPFAELSGSTPSEALSEFQAQLLEEEPDNSPPLQRAMTELEKDEIRHGMNTIPVFSVWDIVVVAASSSAFKSILQVATPAKREATTTPPWNWVFAGFVVLVAAALVGYRYRFYRLRQAYQADVDEGVVLVQRTESGSIIEYLPHFLASWSINGVVSAWRDQQFFPRGSGTAEAGESDGDEDVESAPSQEVRR